MICPPGSVSAIETAPTSSLAGADPGAHAAADRPKRSVANPHLARRAVVIAHRRSQQSRQAPSESFRDIGCARNPIFGGGRQLSDGARARLSFAMFDDEIRVTDIGCRCRNMVAT